MIVFSSRIATVRSREGKEGKVRRRESGGERANTRPADASTREGERVDGWMNGLV